MGFPMIGMQQDPSWCLFTYGHTLKTHTLAPAWFFFIINVAKLPLDIGWQITLKTLGFNVLLLPPLPQAFPDLVVKLLPESAYRWFIIAATFISAVPCF
jgi:hypothetical protein